MNEKIKYYRATLSYTSELTPEEVADWDLSPQGILEVMKEELAMMDGSSIWDNIETEIIYEEDN